MNGVVGVSAPATAGPQLVGGFGDDFTAIDEDGDMDAGSMNQLLRVEEGVVPDLLDDFIHLLRRMNEE